MKKISADNQFQRKIFPVIWFGFLSIMFVTLIYTGAYRKALPMLFVPIFMAVFGFFLMKNLIWDLVDEVYDEGDYLVVKKGREEDRVELSNIMNVSSTNLTNPQRVTLRLVTPGRFGKEIVFCPARSFTLNPFAKNPVAEELIERAYQARPKR